MYSKTGGTYWDDYKAVLDMIGKTIITSNVLGTSIRVKAVFRLCHFVSTIGHYTRIATSGDRRDAFQAGNTPDAKLMVSERSHTRIRSFGRKIGAI